MEDIFISTMLNSNIDELKEQCLTNKQSNQACQKSYFWLNKFKHDHLPFYGSIPTTINGWINRYKEILKLKYKAQDILMINQIESERRIPGLNIININIKKEKYDLTEIFDSIDEGLDEVYNDNFMYSIIIDNNLNGHYIKIYSKINLETGENTEIFSDIEYNEILRLMIYIMYNDPYYEILDNQSNYFFDTEDRIMNYQSTQDMINGFKRLGIIETLKKLS